MKNSSPVTIRLQDYEAPSYLVNSIYLSFNLQEEFSTVDSKIELQRGKGKNPALELDGEKFDLQWIRVNGVELKSSDYQYDGQKLTISRPPEGKFLFEARTKLKPHENLTLEGLYKSGGIFCTQCEAQGFRTVTFYPDRPDVMSVFTVDIEADAAKYPFLLANGNLVKREEVGGRLKVRWHDPFKKPAYLFALVAGDLGKVEDHFVTRSARKVKLEIFVDKGNEDRTAHAMESLKKSMKWDEDTFGLEYDLDIFMIVAVNDFNFGAMENKGLNIFNSNYVLAKPETATDTDYENIEAVVAHEYFHNWTGNRVTCRDWFQLSLKEGLTVYRDQEFSSDMTSRAVCRIDNVNRLRQVQFPEDSGPMAHPIRPSSYIEINNFYTATVYEKGSEVIRMIATVLGKDGFRRGIDKYFELFDGQAVTTEDFVKAMELANNKDLSQFRSSWYEQAGTPEVKVKTIYENGVCKIEFTQSCQPTPGQPTKKPFIIPIKTGFLSPDGKEMGEKLFILTKEKEAFELPLAQKPVLSLLREFSAPVKIEHSYTDQELLLLLAKDSDSFARWESGQNLMLGILEKLVDQHISSKPLSIDPAFLEVVGNIAIDEKIDPALRAQLLTAPDEGYLGQQQAVIQIDANHAATNHLKFSVGIHNEKKLLNLFERIASPTQAYSYSNEQVGLRSLSAVILSRLVRTGKKEYQELALNGLKRAKNMTDETAALTALVHVDSPAREEALVHFYEKWKHETLVMNKWLMLQANSSAPGGLARVKRLMTDPVFSINNPNKVYSLLMAFGRNNLVQFHAKDGEAYKFFADLVLDIDSRNPSVASRLASLFNQWKKVDTFRQGLIRPQLERMVNHSGLSSGVFEIVSKALN